MGACFTDSLSGVSRVGVGFKIFRLVMFGSLDLPEFRSFFSIPRLHFRSFSPSLGVFSLNFGGVFEGRGPEMARLEFSGCHVRAPATSGPPGLHTTARELQTCTIEGPNASNTTKIPREDTPREGRKERILWREREKKKREISGPPPFGAPPFGPSPFVVRKFNIQKLADVEFGRSRIWSKSELAEVEKKKLAEVDRAPLAPGRSPLPWLQVGGRWSDT